MKKFDTLVFIGRFQPFHNGHKAVIDQALSHAKQVIVIVGSSHQARSTKNPFTFVERAEMIRSVYPNEENLIIASVMDYPYDDNAWVSATQKQVSHYTNFGNKIGLIGHSKDHTSYYLKIFPDWKDHIEVENVDGINATDIRNLMFVGGIEPTVLPREVLQWSYSIPNTKWWQNLSGEFKYIRNYKESWKSVPYEPTFVTTDAVLTQSGYILLIKRGGFPFKDCWALPGGYLAQGQTIVDNMIKELREETCVKVPAKVLKGSIKGIEVFDHPDRDPRGRTITHGFHVDLGYPEEGLPKVKGSDDAKEAKWFHLSEVTSEMMAFDHYHIIKRFIPTYGN